MNNAMNYLLANIELRCKRLLCKISRFVHSPDLAHLVPCQLRSGDIFATRIAFGMEPPAVSISRSSQVWIGLHAFSDTVAQFFVSNRWVEAANEGASLTDGVLDVVPRCSKKQVRRIDTGPVVTRVTDKHSCGNFPNAYLIGEPIGSHFSSRNREATVVFRGSDVIPNPAGIRAAGFIDMRPKTLNRITDILAKFFTAMLVSTRYTILATPLFWSATVGARCNIFSSHNHLPFVRVYCTTGGAA